MTDFYDIFGDDDVPVFDRGRRSDRHHPREDRDVVSLMAGDARYDADGIRTNREARLLSGSPTGRLSWRRPGRF